MEKAAPCKIGDLVKNKGGDIGKIVGIKTITTYSIKGTGEEDNVSWCIIVPNTTDGPEKVTAKPRYYKYRHEPCVGCVFLHENKEWIVEGVDRVECGGGGSYMGSPSSGRIITKYYCRNLKTNKKQIFRKGYCFQVIRKLKPITTYCQKGAEIKVL